MLENICAIPFFLEGRLIVVALIVLFSFISAFILRYLLHSFERTKTGPDALRQLVVAARPLAFWTVLITGALYAFEVGFLLGPENFFSKMRALFLLAVGSLVLLRWKAGYGKTLKRRAVKKSFAKDNLALIEGVSKLASAVITIFAGLMGLQILGVELTAIYAFAGLGGVGVGLAASNIIANFFGGFMIHINRHFCVGDWIMSPNKGFEGVVEEIGWYFTKIRTFERRPTYIPNSLITDAIIENPERMYNRRIKETIGVRHQDADKVEVITRDVKAMLQEHPAIDLEQHLFVDFVSLGQSALNIEVYVFTKTTDWKEWRAIQQEIFLKIIRIVVGHGAQLAMPARASYPLGVSTPPAKS